MRGTTRHTFGRVLFAIVAAVASWLPAVPIAAAQTQSFQGQDAVYNSSMAGGPDYEVRFTLEGAPSKLRLGGVFP
jgi:hypothetical protein